jgi:hypothetical protein
MVRRFAPECTHTPKHEPGECVHECAKSCEAAKRRLKLSECLWVQLRSARWKLVSQLHAASLVAPLEGWPGTYASWLSDGVTACAVELDKRKAEAMKRT